MTQPTATPGPGATAGPEHHDVIIVGAGLSGIGAACRLQQELPGKDYAILEGRENVGGTWDLFRYPGIRSDSDMFTLAYPFRPWRERKSIADGADIRRYIVDTAREYGALDRIRFGNRVVGASWDSAAALWTVRTETADGPRTYTCAFLFMCSGYYDYDAGYQPEFPGREDFAGTWVHPQFWPEDLDHAGKKIVVIGSGATAVTLIPSLADQAEHVTMLQRSPSYLTVLPSTDPIADRLRKYLPAKVAHHILRLQYVTLTQAFYQLARRRPERVKKVLRGLALKFLKDESYVDRHFTPSYEPWDQRLCVIPEGDFFRSINAGRASVVTDHIDRITEKGIRLRSGEELPADVVVSATGLSLKPLGGMTIHVDGEQVDIGKTVTYRGLMLSGVPNLAFCIGYVNASWTLRADLVARYVPRLLGMMDRERVAVATPAPTVSPDRPLLDLASGYVKRSEHLFPRQGRTDPWRLRQNFFLDAVGLGRADLKKDMLLTPASAVGARSAAVPRPSVAGIAADAPTETQEVAS
ncbi:monooxygenase, flavin-binding family [Pseudonocardia sp. Ae168_Ps1]|uniref:flavin-containing monooxygenase n=1 Tax=unclassified Pseudonocardia TaxID=2619320 RepID=UPI0001FFE312|nr:MULTISPECIES: NAD(P)/FAD-dependent oxidoreductase [unclassified Pseudonocardia]OLL71803.1 monooxygenase, flavin-binding family [Pseudonocardia sp. Ae150A_Ps1]OLL77770.1 monooxygenase, flavin-binding family [Pseudonocardia sp. Ae168_Ps1]OLL88106.1 monooxygenase, flavin-binding family [Pseudonocardia sp. Ae263_Ps1]OLL91868.1 monooxygenase, flavin-binding family [Pseudonocardia sp. Ae356_Ps1]OLM18381.1 monooxygenase, flavin-binding family [Pseudonocardia sp. Ae707_Ps1]